MSTKTARARESRRLSPPSLVSSGLAWGRGAGLLVVGLVLGSLATLVLMSLTDENVPVAVQEQFIITGTVLGDRGDGAFGFEPDNPEQAFALYGPVAGFRTRFETHGVANLEPGQRVELTVIVASTGDQIVVSVERYPDNAPPKP